VVITSVPSVAGQLAGNFTLPKGGQAMGLLYALLAPT
jgi:hypothetical protein